MYSEYRGFKYSLLSEGKWSLTLPSGIRSQVEAANEAALKAMIDDILES